MTTRQAALSTVWIAIVGTIVSSWIAISLWSLLESWRRTDYPLERALYDMSAGSVIWLLTYGLFFWIPFLLIMVLLDLIVFRISTMSIRAGLLGEWLLIALAVTWLAAPFPSAVPFLPVVALLLAQLYREKWMRRMLERRSAFGIAMPRARADV
jgi:hypothetical protein